MMKTIGIAIAFAFTNSISCLTLTQAQPTTIEIADLPIPPDTGTPTGRGSGATRGPCQEPNRPFTPLLPLTETGYSGYTLSEHPTFWFYVPYKIENVRSGTFLLKDQDDNALYKTTFTLPTTPGFVSVQIPTTAMPLEVNKQYSWIFELYCGEQNRSDLVPVSQRGIVERIDSMSFEQLATATAAERLNLYIDNNIWYDVPTDLAEIRSIPPAWLKLLRAVGLEELKQDAIAGSVIPIEN
ncbi:DUF928 domain-containing protein [Microcoleus sp. FACHB-SPT15]|uniref:DUF928 domain-containing protein n=1 Tax=Microcoleus sp. FACHB-SPT15 TaxID=2692830 RepID=UPI00177ABE05|nr:DUF928 domain-containing protein [Microcoleus sp. FACHB-SPT15]MBD1806291.1 DUF928 domain-containing protein [Microcoleus sp. FACHB-SPT15]